MAGGRRKFCSPSSQWRRSEHRPDSPPGPASKPSSATSYYVSLNVNVPEPRFAHLQNGSHNRTSHLPGVFGGCGDTPVMLSMVPGAQEVPSVGALEQNGYSQAWGESFKIQSLGRQVGTF